VKKRKIPAAQKSGFCFGYFSYFQLPYGVQIVLEALEISWMVALRHMHMQESGTRK
jgi:hypothetical protein